MAYTETAVLHEGTYTPTAPAAAYDSRSRAVDANSSLQITVFQHDDADPVPAGGVGEIERWTLSVSSDQANKLAIRRQAEQAMTQLATIRDAGTLTNQQMIDAIQYQAQVLRRLVRLSVGLYDSTD